MTALYRYYDFFAGGGMAGYGLGDAWQCVFANDFSSKKAEYYRLNHSPADELLEADVHTLTPAMLPRGAHLSWASFPCQDLSLAGNGKGLDGERSGAFWGYWRLMSSLVRDWEPVPIVVLENVPGTITANGGRDFATLLGTLSDNDYVYGALTMDAAHFVPQSRARLFIVALHRDYLAPRALVSSVPGEVWHSSVLRRTYARLAAELRRDWVWWTLPSPPGRSQSLADVLEEAPQGVKWHTAEQTHRLIDLMAPAHRQKLLAAMQANARVVGTIYKRTRRSEDGRRGQRAELRLDGISGCLRTAGGGSSRQTLLVAQEGSVRTRLLSPREGARLMGLPDTYVLPPEYNAALDLIGDGLAVPVVRWLSEHLLTPLAESVTGRTPVTEERSEVSLTLWEGAI